MDVSHLHAEDWLRVIVQYLRLAVEAVGGTIVTIGVGFAAVQFITALLKGRTADFNAIRLTLARYLAVALEFQLGADILSTAVAPTWNEIGKLGSIAVIRTTLNYFLSKEMDRERAAEKAGTESAVAQRAASAIAESHTTI